MNLEQSIYLILYLLLLLYIPWMFLFYKSRFIHPVKGRSPRASLLAAIIAILVTTMDCVSIVLNGPCVYQNLIGVPLGMFWNDIIMYRLANLLFSYHIAQNIAHLKDKRFEEWKFNWYTRHRNLVQSRFVAITGTCLFSINIILIALFLGAGKSICQGDFATVAFLELTARIIVCSIMAAKMWKFSDDAFGMRTEFKVYLSVFIVETILALMAPLFPGIKHYPTFIIMLGMHVVFFSSIFLPYWHSRAMDNKPDVTTLKDWLTYPDGVRLFSDYLQTEFSQENLFFWVEVNRYKTIPLQDLDALKYTAQELWNKFVDRNAPYSVNIKFGVVESVSEKIQSLLAINKENPIDEDWHLIFEEAQTEIYHLMASDSFPRFQQTPTYIRPSKREHAQSSLQEVEILLQQTHQDKGEEISAVEEHSPRSLADPTPRSEMRMFGGGSGSELVQSKSLEGFNLEHLKHSPPSGESYRTELP